MMRRVCIISLVIFTGCTQTSDKPKFYDSLSPLSAMNGCWESADGQAREVWSGDPSGWMFGFAVNRDTDDNVTFFEQMRIDGEALFVTGPNDDTVTFKLTGNGPDFIFENPDHDFPQRIVYQPSPGRLDAYISAMDGSNKIEFQKQACE